MALITLRDGASIDTSVRARVMGVVNATPDSFYAPSRVSRDTLGRVDAMIEAGVDIIDVGGESSRPGSDYVESEIEIARVLPIIDYIRRRTNIPISIDTRKAAVAQRALDSGADIVNDISALRDDPDLAPLVARKKVPVALTHMRGTPLTMQNNPRYNDAVADIADELAQWAKRAETFGISPNNIIIDPGIGFGKRLVDNVAIISRLSRFRELSYPLMIGISRKSFIGKLLDDRHPRDPEERLAGTIALQTIALLNGADIIRAHDVAEAMDAARVVSAIGRMEATA